MRRRKLVDSKKGENIPYIDPENNVEKIRQYNNNIIQARRGCGKTSLILKSLENYDCTSVTIDCQCIRRKDEKDIVLYIVNELLQEIVNAIEKKKIACEIQYREKTGFLWGILHRRRFKKDKERIRELRSALDYVVKVKEKVNRIIDYPAEFNVDTQIKQSNQKIHKKISKLQKYGSVSTDGKIELCGKYKMLAANLDFKNEGMISTTFSRESEDRDEDAFDRNTKISKVVKRDDEIINLKDDIKNVLECNSEILGYGTMLFLDDFYQVTRKSHPFIIQFFHDIYKVTTSGTFCFKIVTLPSTLKLNYDSETIFSEKDDFSKIVLDSDLSNLEDLQNKLIDILVGMNQSKLVVTRPMLQGLFTNDETVKFCVIATGGIPRDFMTLFSDLVSESVKEEKQKIGKDQLYSIIRKLKEDKSSNIEIDSELANDKIESALDLIEKLVIKEKKTNVILYPLDKVEQHERILRNLVNLRYLHIIKEKITSEHTKENCRAYLIDMTFYATSRMTNGFIFCHFWEKDEASRPNNLRRSPVWFFPDEEARKILES